MQPPFDAPAPIAATPAARPPPTAARRDPKSGKDPAAVAELRDVTARAAAEIIAFCRDHIAHSKAPGITAGKRRKFNLRTAARELGPKT